MTERRTTPAWDAIREVVDTAHRGYCMSSHDHDVKIDQDTDELYDAVAREQR